PTPPAPPVNCFGLPPPPARGRGRHPPPQTPFLGARGRPQSVFWRLPGPLPPGSRVGCLRARPPVLLPAADPAGRGRTASPAPPRRPQPYPSAEEAHPMMVHGRDFTSALTFRDGVGTKTDRALH